MFRLTRDQAGLLLIDIQEKLFPFVENSCFVMKAIQKIIQGFQILKLPIAATEQYPQGLGATLPILKGLLGAEQPFFTKTCFSCLEDGAFKEMVLHSAVQQWVLAGIEAHVCVLQTAKDLVALGKQVTVLNDATSSRSIYDYSTAIAEMRDCKVRISTGEIVLFELLRDSKAAEFKEISRLIK